MPEELWKNCAPVREHTQQDRSGTGEGTPFYVLESRFLLFGLTPYARAREGAKKRLGAHPAEDAENPALGLEAVLSEISSLLFALAKC